MPRAPSHRVVASTAHGCWQLDFQDAIPLADTHRVSICTIRDAVGAAILSSRAFDVTTGSRGRRLSWQEVREVIRGTFEVWQTLPDGIQTDNEVCLGEQPSDPLPNLLTLWLIGLGVTPHFIRPSTPPIRAHRTHSPHTGWLCRLAQSVESTICRCN